MREMKDNGIPWIGKYPPNWTVGRVKNIINVLTDYTANGSFGNLAKNVTYLDKGFARLIRLTDLRENLQNNGVYVNQKAYQYLAKSKLFGKEILIANVGAYAGLICEMPIPNMPATLGPNMYLIRTNSKMISHYFFYLGNTKLVQEQLKQRAISSAQPKLNKDDVKTVHILIPPVEEQCRIADFLDSKCARIDSIRKNVEAEIEALKQYKQSVITEAVTKGLDKDVEMKDSGIPWIGKIPKHWKIHPVYFYFNARKHRNSLGKEKNLLSLSYGKIIEKDINQIGGLLPESFNTYNIVESGDIIIRPTDLQNDKRSLRTGLVKEHGIITSAYIDLMSIRPVNTVYYHYLLHTYDVMKVFYNMGNGVRQGLNFSEFSHLMLFEPTVKEQQQIADYLDSKCSKIDSIIQKKQEVLQDLDTYKKSLIYEYVTGKKEVPAV